MTEKNRHDNRFLRDLEAPGAQSIEHLTDEKLEAAYDRYFRRFADITGDAVLEQYCDDTDFLPEHPILSTTVSFTCGVDDDQRAEAIYVLAHMLNGLAAEAQKRIRRSPGTCKNRLLELARTGAERPPDHTLLGKALRVLTTADDPH